MTHTLIVSCARHWMLSFAVAVACALTASFTPHGLADELRVSIQDLSTDGLLQDPIPENSAAPNGADDGDAQGGAPVPLPLAVVEEGRLYLDRPVTTVAREPSTIGRSAAAVFVISQDMIHRSGARSIPEALRLAPGLHVARIDANKWSITSRGFSGRFARKLLVQIDGRTVYTPLFGGTFWDVQDVLLADVERIEVIRGPGGTLWGENAVNGVINIITKSAKDTHGAYAQAGGGTEEKAFGGGRIGGVTQHGIHYRVYGKGFERDDQFEPNGQAHDDWRQGRVGFRTDWSDGCQHAITVQGDLYQGDNGNAILRDPFGLAVTDEPVWGANVLGRWTRTFDEETESVFQVYYDRADRTTFAFDQNINTLDFDYQFRYQVNCCRKRILGAGYRRVWDNLPTAGTPDPFRFDPVQRTTHVASAFVQDEFTIVEDRSYFTIGSKLSHNSYTDLEVQPSARILYLPDERTAAWAAVSRAVHVPTRAEHDAQLVIGELPAPAPPGTPAVLFGRRSVNAEELIAYELGVRQQPNEYVYWDLALFYNVYEDLVSFRPTMPVPVIPTFEFFNGESGDAYGCELYVQLNMTDCWRLSGWYSFVRLDLDASPQAVATGDANSRATPRNQAQLMSSWNIDCDKEFDLIARYVDSAPSIGVPSYLSLDARLAWRPRCGMELSLVGQNLLQPHHAEYSTSVFSGDIPTQVQRGVYGMIVWEH